MLALRLNNLLNLQRRGHKWALRLSLSEVAMREILFCLIFLSFLPASLAVGFANLPSNTEVIFEPYAVHEYTLKVVNAPRIDVQFSSQTPAHPETLGTAEDDNILAYVQLDDPDPQGGPREVHLKIGLPGAMKPGIYYVDVFASEIPEKTEATISALASMKMRITVHVLSDEKRIEVLGVSVPATQQGVDSNASVFVVSRTTQDIDSVIAHFNIYDGDALVAETRSISQRLASRQQGELKAPLGVADLPGGEYKVNGTVVFDGSAIGFPEQTLKIGTLHVSIPEHTKSLIYNETNRFSFSIANEWNRELRDVYAHVAIGTQTKKTASQHIPAFDKTGYEVYFDREAELHPGIKDVSITVTYLDFDPATQSYASKTDTIVVQITVVRPPIVETPGLPWRIVILSGAVSLIILLLLLVVLLMLRKSRKESTEDVKPPEYPI